MKLKLLFLILASTLLTYLIFTTNVTNQLNIFSIFDKTTITNPNYNDYLQEYLNNVTNYTYNIDYSNKNLEIENVISALSSNKNKIQEKIYEAEVIIIHLGDFEILKEDITPSEILTETEELFSYLRKINKKQIIFLSPVNIKSYYMYKNICQKYNITYINTYNILKPHDISNNLITATGHTKIAKLLYNEISTTWNI